MIKYALFMLLLVRAPQYHPVPRSPALPLCHKVPVGPDVLSDLGPADEPAPIVAEVQRLHQHPLVVLAKSHAEEGGDEGII